MLGYFQLLCIDISQTLSFPHWSIAFWSLLLYRHKRPTETFTNVYQHVPKEKSGWGSEIWIDCSLIPQRIPANAMQTLSSVTAALARCIWCRGSSKVPDGAAYQTTGPPYSQNIYATWKILFSYMVKWTHQNHSSLKNKRQAFWKMTDTFETLTRLYVI